MKFTKPPRNQRTTPLTFRERIAALNQLPRFFKLVWQASPRMTVANFILRLVRSAVPLALLYVGRLIIDQVVQMNRSHTTVNSPYLWELVGLELLLAIGADGLNRAITLLDSLLGDLFSNFTSIRIMEHAATLDLDQFEDAVFYDKFERARQQTLGRTVLLSQMMSQVQDVITMLFLAAGLMAFNPWLLLLLLIAILPAFLGESYFNDQSYALTRSQTPERRELDYLRYLGASDETAKETKLFNLSGFIISRFTELSSQFYEANRRLSINRSVWGLLFALLGSLGYYGAYIFIIYRTIQGRVTVGELTFLAGSFRQLRSLLETILTRFSTVSQGAIYLRDFFDFFEIQPRIRPVVNGLPFPNPMQTGFSFEDVGYQYINTDRWANRHLTFTLHPGEKLALVGENGAGKTTLVKLLARLYEPTEGRILLDGIDLKQYDLTDLRLHIGVIFQDYLRYQMPLNLNIAAGRIDEKHNQPRIEQAAIQSLADTVVAKLPGGYRQMLGKRFANGVDLSGGEWQKVALARAYMRSAELLILDEPTSALDARAEYEVFERFSELTHGKTAVLISHRFSTVRMADRILVLQQGQLAEIGSHEELLANGGRYADLFNLQAMGYR